MMKLKTMYNILLLENLPISLAKKYVSIERNPAILERLNSIFNKLSSVKNSKSSKNGHRIYIPFQTSNSGGIGQFEDEIKKTLEKNNYKILDYKKGIASDPYGREIKIGKALTKIKSLKLLNKFNNDKSRESKTHVDSYVIFSKHPYDIAGSSTDRGWTSCMNLYTGSNREYIQQDIKEGSIVCYLIGSNDLNINKPIARVLIKPFINTENSKDVLYVPEQQIYGTAPDNFLEFVTDLLENIQGDKVGKFKLISGLYCDTERYVKKFPNKIINKEQLVMILEWFNIKYYIINNDLSVDVDVHVKLTDKKISNIPIKFGTVNGTFECSMNKLTSLKNAPEIVKGNFNCWSNKLTSLEGSPKEVGGDFDCFDNRLTSLEGAPKYYISGDFNCSDNELTSLDGAPEQLGGDFKCRANKLTSLEGAPKEVGGTFNCSKNKLTSLKGAPEKVGWDFNCSNNPTKFTEEDVRKVCDVKGNIIV